MNLSKEKSRVLKKEKTSHQYSRRFIWTSNVLRYLPSTTQLHKVWIKILSFLLRKMLRSLLFLAAHGYRVLMSIIFSLLYALMEGHNVHLKRDATWSHELDGCIIRRNFWTQTHKNNKYDNSWFKIKWLYLAHD